MRGTLPSASFDGAKAVWARIYIVLNLTWYDLASWVFPQCRDLFLAIATILLAATALPEAPSTVLPGPLDSAQIVARMTARDQARNVGLQHYQSLRHYKVQYHGYSTTVAASMSVEVNYDIGSGKSFQHRLRERVEVSA